MTDVAPTSPVGEPTPDAPGSGGRKLAINGGLWSAASAVVPALGTAVLSVAAGRLLGSSALGQQSLIAYTNSAASSVIIYSLNTALLQLGGRLQGRGDRRSLQALTRWAVGAHVSTGLVVLATMATSSLLVGQNHVAWLTIGVVSVADAAADGLAVRLILAEGWAPIGRLRLVFQLMGPPLGIAFLAAGYGITGIFVGDGLAAFGLLVAVAVRFRRLRGRPLTGVRNVAPSTSAFDDVPTLAGARPPFGEEARTAQVWGLRAGRWGPITPRRRRAERWRPPVPVARTYVLFAVDAVITQVVSRRVEFVILAIFSTDTAIGMYSVAFMAVNLISMVPLGIAAAAMPLIAAAEGRGEVAVATRHVRFALRIGSLVGIPLVGLLAAIGPSAVTLVYGSAYDEAARLVPIASLGLLVAVVSGVCSQYWAGRGRLRIVVVSGLIAAAADLAVAFALIPHFNAVGAVIANLVGQGTFALALIVATVRFTGAVGWKLRGVVASLFASACAAAAGFAAGHAATHLVHGVELRAAIVLVVGTVVFGIVVVVVSTLVKILSPDEREWLGPLVPGPLRGLLGRLSLAGAAS